MVSVHALVPEIARLLGAGLIALLVARLAVPWALGRFKKEKLWERQVSALSDIVTSLIELRRHYGRVIDDIEQHRQRNKSLDDEYQRRFTAARMKLDDATALGALLLPKEVNQRLAALENARENVVIPKGPVSDPFKPLYEHYSLVEDAIEDVVALGRNLIPFD